MWTVKDGRLYCGADLVAVRRVVVELVARGVQGPVSEGQVRTMIRMERALSLRSLTAQLNPAPAS